jgi:pyruvate,water dikinase
MGRIKAHLVRFAVRRYRALAGLREAPKFFAIRMMGIMRQGLLASGEQMVAAGLFEQADDLFFLHVAELKDLANQLANWKVGDNPPASLVALRLTIKERRALREREMRRAQIPRVLLSDGTAYYEGLGAVEAKEGQFFGDPVSPGVVEGAVRVVFNPLDAKLQPGEILVCPGTDPAWTPLFLTASGLVMETGGMMTHGSVVAREYGIPAVVGVHQATSRLHTGDRIRVDGRSGLIEVM